MANGKVFCAYPYLSLFVSNSGKQLPCCYAQNSHKSEVPAPNIVNSKNTTDLWNSDYIRNIRKMMSEGQFPAACMVCEKMEALRGESHRQRSLKQFDEEISSINRVDTYVVSPIRHLDIRLGNKCNLACRMCHPASSNQLIPEWLLSDDISEREEAQDVLKLKPWSRSESAIKLLQSDVVDPVYIHFAGGEPAIDVRHEKILEHLIATNKSHKVTLSYNTNLTQKISALKFLDKFKKIKITASIDGVGAINDYIRAPSQWQVIEKNLLEYIDLSNNSDKIQLEINVTLSAYNIIFIKDILVYFSQLPKKSALVPVFTIVEDPEWLNFDVLPPPLKMKAESSLQEALSVFPYFNETELLRERLVPILNHIKYSKWNPQLFEKFCIKTEFYDRQRKVSLFTVMPLWKEYWIASARSQVDSVLV